MSKKASAFFVEFFKEILYNSVISKRERHNEKIQHTRRYNFGQNG